MKKQNRHEDNSLSGLVKQCIFPAGGISELQTRFYNEILPSMVSYSNNNIVLNKNNFLFFMKALYVALYIFDLQGRPSGLSHLNYMQMHNVHNIGIGYSKEFKTQNKYLMQGVIIHSEVSKCLFYIYITYVRSKINIPGHGIDDPNSPLFVNFDGTRELHIPRYFTQFMHQTFQIHFTINNMR